MADTRLRKYVLRPAGMMRPLMVCPKLLSLNKRALVPSPVAEEALPRLSLTLLFCIMDCQLSTSQNSQRALGKKAQSDLIHLIKS
jgi:hypothetical protein